MVSKFSILKSVALAASLALGTAAMAQETPMQRVERTKTLRVGNIFALFQVGDMPGDKVRHSTQLFAEKVMPKLRNIYPEFEDDGRFWCKPIKFMICA